MDTIKVVIGVIIIIISFIYILRRPDKSMIQNMTEERNKKMQKAKEEQQALEAQKSLKSAPDESNQA